MQRRAFLASLLIIVSLLGMSLVSPAPALAASADCGQIPSISGTYGSGDTNGWIGTFAPGDYVVMTVTLGTATTGSFRIVGSPAGTPTLAGPSPIPGTLSYTVTGPLPPGSIGIGFFIDSADGTVNVAVSCGDATQAYQGPPIPEGFVLRTITCDVAVFDTPGGQPVGDNRIIGGQTWYVNPTPVTAPDGTSWTEIFVSGTPNGYIPTRCVGG